MLDAGCWILDIGYWMLDTEYWTMEPIKTAMWTATWIGIGRMELREGNRLGRRYGRRHGLGLGEWNSEGGTD